MHAQSTKHKYRNYKIIPSYINEPIVHNHADLIPTYSSGTSIISDHYSKNINAAEVIFYQIWYLYTVELGPDEKQ